MMTKRTRADFAGFSKMLNAPEKVEARRKAAELKHQAIMRRAAYKNQQAILKLKKISKIN